MVSAYVALGANLGDAAATVRWAIERLALLPKTTLLACSSLYRSDPVDAVGPDFINAVVALRTALSAIGLLGELQGLEQLAGRKRPYHHAPRTLDLDLLLYGNDQIESPGLSVPHPRMLQRAFVLLPLAEIAPHRVVAAQLQAVQSQRINRLERQAHAGMPDAGPGCCMGALS
ncbi:MAG: 2-amino-4-hydroxy-6-hydroxymethyldihydropteridine diphosphokinase [Rhodoferax sp.]